jgi:diguanylate cyclase (GGDEF)-like protein
MTARILVVDDDPDVVASLGLALKEAGYEVEVLRDGAGVPERVAELRPDLLLLDLALPSADGLEVVAELRRRPQLAGMGILVISGRSLASDRVRALALGVDDYLVKPIEPEVLVAKVGAVLRRIHHMRSLSPLTGLPSSSVIEEQVRARLADGRGFAVLYADLDHFKALNDTKGWDVGNRVILTAAEILDEGVRTFGGTDGFVAHIGGDDFLALVPPSAAEETAAWMCRRFTERVRRFYTPEELEHGCIVALDRRGESTWHPLVSLSVGVATTSVRTFEHFGEVVAVATEMKRLAKRGRGSCYAVDRRAGRPRALK